MIEESTEPSTGQETAGAPARSRRGLLVLAVVFAIVLASSAIKNSMTAYLVPMGMSFGASRGAFALTPTLFMVTYAVMSPLVGYFADRYGGQRTMTAGLATGAAMFLLATGVHSLPVFMVLYGVGLATAYTAVSYVPLGVLVNELFAEGRRGVMYSLLTNGTAVGFVVLSPLWIMLSSSTSWRSVYLALGVVFLALLALAVTLVPRRDPEPLRDRAGAPSLTLRGRLGLVLRERRFWIVAVPFFACGTSMAFVDVNMVADMQGSNLSGGMISTSVAVLGAAEIAGSVAAGYFADRGRRRVVLIGSYAVRGISLVTLLMFPGAAGSVAFALLFGFSYMGTVIVSSLYLMEIFDERSRGLALGLLWFVHQTGSAASSYGGAMSYDAFNSYNVSVAAIAGTIALAVLISSTFSLESNPQARKAG